MKTQRIVLRLSASALAVQGALGLMAAAQAQTDPALAELTQPRRTVEVGVAGMSSFSAKANEYAGLRDKGLYPLLGFELDGGGAYDSKDATRWRLAGSDLGTQSRSLAAEYGIQGSFRVKLGYDELLRNQSDSYQTPYLGIGSNLLTLPSTWRLPLIPRLSATTPSARGLSPDVTNSSAIVGGVLTPPTPAQLAAATAVQAADLPAFRQVDLYTRRTRYELGWEQQIDSRWLLSTGISYERKEGLKPQGAHTHANGGDTSSILPTPIDQEDRKATLGLGYSGEKLQVQAGYEVAAFRNDVPSVSWNLWSAPTATPTLMTMSTAPSNLFQKVLLSASYQAAPSTRVVAAASYSRSTQNDSFLSDPITAPIVPAASARALVVGESASLKVFNRSFKDVSLSAGYKYDLHENRTPVKTYVFYDNQEAPSGVSPFRYLFPTLPNLGTDVNIAANTPYSNKINQINLDADYQLKPGNHIKAGWTTSKTERYCVDSWIQCVNAAASTEHTLQADWFGHPGADLSARLGLAASRRTVDYDENSFLARVPMANQVPTGAPAGTTAYSTLLALGLNGYGPALGLTPAAAAGSAQAFYFPLNNALSNVAYGYRNRISELLGMRRFDQADRNRGKVRSSLTWQATEALELQAGLDYKDDHYAHSVYGLQRLRDGALNLDATFTPSDDLSVALFGSFEESRQRMAGNSYTANSAATAVNGATAISGGCFATIALRNASNKIDPCEDWTSTQRDRTLTFGASLTKKRLLSGKLDLQGGLTYSNGRTDIDPIGGSYVNNPYAGIASATNGTIAAYYVPASALPTIRSKAIDLRLSGLYRLDNQSQVRLSYGFQRLSSTDWGYEGMQDGTLTQVLPTREQAPSYRVHSIGISYQVSFR